MSGRSFAATEPFQRRAGRLGPARFRPDSDTSIGCSPGNVPALDGGDLAFMYHGDCAVTISFSQKRSFAIGEGSSVSKRIGLQAPLTDQGCGVLGQSRFSIRKLQLRSDWCKFPQTSSRRLGLDPIEYRVSITRPGRKTGQQSISGAGGLVILMFSDGSRGRKQNSE